MKLAPRYTTLDGKDTTADDPERGIWYGCLCTYWTDDWAKLRYANIGIGIPVCPFCKRPGMQTDADDWFGSAKEYEANGHPGYLTFLMAQKEKCGEPKAIRTMTSFLPEN